MDSEKRNVMFDFAGMAVAILVAEVLSKVLQSRPAGWFVGGMLMALSAQVFRAPEERRTVPFTIVAMILTGAVAAAVTLLVARL